MDGVVLWVTIDVLLIVGTSTDSTFEPRSRAGVFLCMELIDLDEELLLRGLIFDFISADLVEAPTVADEWLVLSIDPFLGLSNNDSAFEPSMDWVVLWVTVDVLLIVGTSTDVSARSRFSRDSRELFTSLICCLMSFSWALQSLKLAGVATVWDKVISKLLDLDSNSLMEVEVMALCLFDNIVDLCSVMISSVVVGRTVVAVVPAWHFVISTLFDNDDCCFLLWCLQLINCNLTVNKTTQRTTLNLVLVTCCFR